MNRVLVVDDEVSIGLALKVLFEKRGYTCDIATNLITGVFQALHFPYKAVILDNMFPEMITGADVENILRKKDIPTIMFTASDTIQGVMSPIIHKNEGSGHLIDAVDKLVENEQHKSLGGK